MLFRLSLAGIVFLFFPKLLSAQDSIPPEAIHFFEKAINAINPRHVSWINKTAADAHARNLDENMVMRQTRNYGISGNLNQSEIEAMAMLVMMQAAKSAAEDLKAIMDGVKTINKEKEQVRVAQQYLDANSTSVSVQLLDSFRQIAKPVSSATNIQNKSARVSGRPAPSITNKSIRTVTATSRNITPEELKSTQDALNEKMKSLNEMSDLSTLRLQMMMDRRSKFISTLSNIMKKISDTQDTIIQNLK